MKSQTSVIRNLRSGGIAVFAAAGLMACVPMHQEPQQVDSDAPTVTYNYATDNDLVAANEKARAYCSQYQTVPSMNSTVTTEQNGTKTVTFTCVKASNPPQPMVQPQPQPPAPMTYTYTTDAQLLQMMRSADSQCAAYGQRASANIVSNGNGTRTVTFRCVPA